jgi:hypothetical protein
MAAILVLAGPVAFFPCGTASEGPRTADNNNSLGTAANITSGVPVNDSVDRNDDRYDFWKIDALSGQVIRASVNWTTSSADIRLDICATDDSSILFNGEVSRTSSSITVVGDAELVITNGTYYVRINAQSGASAYNLTVTADYPPALNWGTPATGSLHSGTDRRTDWYRGWLNGSSGGQAEAGYIDLTRTNTNTYVGKRVYDILNFQSRQEYNSSNSQNTYSNLSWAASYTGWYYYRLYARSGGGGGASITDYTLYNGKYMKAADGDNDHLNATPQPKNAHIQGTLDKAFDHYDWHSYNVTTGDVVLLNVTRLGNSRSFNVTIYDSQLNLLQTSQTNGGTNPLNLVTMTAPSDDTYYIMVMLRGYYNNGITDDFVSMPYWLNFSSPNHNPATKSLYSAMSINEDEHARIYASDHFYDADGDNLTYRVTSATNILGSWNTAINDFEIYGKPNWFGSETVTILVTDPMGGWVSTPINVTVQPVEDLPFLNRSLPNITMTQNSSDSSLDLSKYFVDNDTPYGDKLTWGVFDNGSIWVSMAASGKVTLTGDISFWGVQNLTFTATDNAQDTASGLCRVTVNHVNQPPQVKSQPPEVTVDEDDTIVIDMSPVFWDPDSDPITIIASGNAQVNLTQQPGTMNLTVRPAPDASGFSESIRLDARDDKGAGGNFVILKVTVVPANDPPRITQANPVTDVVMNENTSQQFNVTAWDPESGQVINYTWYLDGQPVMLGVSSYVLKTDFSSAGNHTVMVSVGDGELFAMKSWNVSVLNLNREPADLKIVSPRPGEIFREGTVITLEGTAQDPDGDPLTYSWHEGARELGTGRVLETVLSPGVHAVVFRVSDGTSPVSTPQMQFQIKANTQPQLFGLDPPNGQKFAKGAKIFFTAQAGDPDGDNVTFCWTENGRPLSTSASFYKSDLPVGVHHIQLSISDGRAAANTTLTIEITPATSGGGDTGQLMMIVIVVIVVAVVAAVGAAVMRRKRPPVAVARPVEEDTIQIPDF